MQSLPLTLTCELALMPPLGTDSASRCAAAPGFSAEMGANSKRGGLETPCHRRGQDIPPLMCGCKEKEKKRASSQQRQLPHQPSAAFSFILSGPDGRKIPYKKMRLNASTWPLAAVIWSGARTSTRGEKEKGDF